MFLESVKIQNCLFPKNYLYDVDNFIWLNFENKLNENLSSNCQYVTIGITPVLSYMAGSIVKAKLKPLHDVITKGKSLGSVESLKYFGVIRSPVTGQIVEINDTILQAPKILNDYPFDQGWVAKLKLMDNNGINLLKPIEDCKDDLLNQIKQFDVKCFKLFPDYQMFELGTECSKTLAKLGEFMENNMKTGQVIRLVSDDPTADLELTRWIEENKQELVEIVEEKKILETSGRIKTGYFFNIIIKKL